MTKYHKKLVELTHILLCNLPHPEGGPEELTNPKNNLCYFNQEAVMEDAEQYPAHTYWIKEAEQIILDLQAESPEEAHSKLQELLYHIQEITKIAPDSVWKVVGKIIWDLI